MLSLLAAQSQEGTRGGHILKQILVIFALLQSYYRMSELTIYNYMLHFQQILPFSTNSPSGDVSTYQTLPHTLVQRAALHRTVDEYSNSSSTTVGWNLDL